MPLLTFPSLVYNFHVKSNPLPTSATFAPAAAGALYCIAAALLYTMSNICLRKLAVGGDGLRVIAIRESITPLLIGPWLALCAWRGQRILPRGRVLLLLVLTGLATELIGNIGSFWALGIIGLAIEIPVVVGVTITSATILGRIFLGERVPPRSVLALAILVVSIVLLNLGAGDANHAMAAHAPILAGSFWVVSAILVTCAAGVAFGLLSLSIRVAVTNRVTPEAAVVTIAIFGPLCLAPIAFCRSGFQQCLTMSGYGFGLTLLNGLLNTAAFLCLSKGLQRTTIVHANVVNASQIAMATVAGLLLFAEPLGGMLIAGVALTIFGVVLIECPSSARHTELPPGGPPRRSQPLAAVAASLVEET